MANFSRIDFNREFIVYISKRIKAYALSDNEIDCEKIDKKYDQVLFDLYNKDIIDYKQLHEWKTPKRAYDMYFMGQIGRRGINSTISELQSHFKKNKMQIEYNYKELDVSYSIEKEEEVRSCPNLDPGNPGFIDVNIGSVFHEGNEILPLISRDELEDIKQIIIEKHDWPYDSI